MKRLINLMNKLAPLMGIQASIIGINSNGELINYRKSLDIPNFVDFLLEDKKSKTKEDFSIQSSYGMQNLYEITNRGSNVYEFENGKLKLTSGTENKQFSREYLTQKLVAIQALKNQIDFGNN